MQTGTLNVYVNGSTNVLSWTLSGNQQNQWNQGQLPIPKMSTSYTVSILSLGLHSKIYQDLITITSIKKRNA